LDLSEGFANGAFRLRIAVVTTSYPESHGDPSGHFVLAEVSASRNAGNDVEVIAPRPGGAFGWPGVLARVRAQPLRVIDVARFVQHARVLVRRGGFDRIVAHWALPSALPIATACTSPLEIVSHGGDVRLLGSLPAPVREAAVGKLAARAELWRFVSDTLLASLLRRLSSRSAAAVERIAKVVPPPLDLPTISPEDVTRLRTKVGALYVSVGRLVHKKRVDRVLYHVAEQRKQGEPVELVVVGDGPERAKLTRLAAALEVPARFVGKTTHPEALAWIAAADALAFASEEEGLSTVLREAAALGTAIVHV